MSSVVCDDGRDVCGFWNDTRKTWLYVRPEPLIFTASHSVTGRVEIAPVYEIWGDEVCVNADVGRWTGASVAGLVVAAMGVFVFAVYLRMWVEKHRAWRKEAEGA